jgi:membrane protease YdiL (CAAX protease family)
MSKDSFKSPQELLAKSPHKNKSSRLDIKAIIVALALVAIIYVVSQVTALVTYQNLGAPSVKISSDLRFAGAYIAATLTSGALLVYVIKNMSLTAKSLWLKKPSYGDVGQALLGFGLYVLLSRIVFAALSVLVPSINLSQKQDIGFGQAGGAILAVIFVAIVVAPALFEELLFRGFLRQRLMAARVSYAATAVICSALFGLAHGQVNVAVDTFVLSLVMFFVLRDRCNLWVSVGIHALKNSLAFIAIFIFKVV